MVKRSSSQGTATILDHDVLNDEGEDGDKDEPPIVADTGANVEFLLSKLTGVELVEELHEHECLENHGVKLALFSGYSDQRFKVVRLLLRDYTTGSGDCFFLFFDPVIIVVERIALLNGESKDLGSPDEHSQKDNELVYSLAEDVSPHDIVNNLFGLASWLAFHECIVRWLSSEGKCSEGVHDKVNPEHLDGGKRRVVEDHRTGEDNDQGCNVDSKLELKELSDVIEDVPSVLDGNLN